MKLFLDTFDEEVNKIGGLSLSADSEARKVFDCMINAMKKYHSIMCDDNWCSILSEYECMIGSYFINNGTRYLLAGITHAEDDYYYLMYDVDKKKYTMVSCVGSLEQLGYEETY
jgi:hypothetical protein